MILRNVLLLGLMSSFVSCGSLKLSPQGCRTNGLWGKMVEAGIADKEIAISEEFYVWNVDHEVKLKDILKAHQVDCSEVKKLRVQMRSVFFVKRELSIFVEKF